MKKLPEDKEALRESIRPIWANGYQIRGASTVYFPRFKEKVKLLFSKDFKVLVGGHPVKSNFIGKFRAIFTKGFTIKKQGEIIGTGLLESELVSQMGYTKRDLAKLVSSGILEKKTVRVDGGWRNAYVLLK